MVEDKISVVARIRPGWGEGQVEWIKNGERNIMRKDGSEIYTFDDVFDQLCTNEQIYENVMTGIVDSALAGFNTAVCAYGQSGAGKTHTLTGSEDEDGIVQNTFDALLETISKASSNDRKYMLRISYIEIYNERIRDLLSDIANDLPIYENKEGVAQIEGLKEVVVTEKAEVEELLKQAQERRQLGETRLNERSSRSHTIIRLTIESHDVKYGGNATRCSIMNLVDLAGSENAAAAGTQGLRQKEGANINRSLLALSKVVSSLADNQKFIPYRDSKLTRILKPSLGGSSKTAIICCVAPFSVAETSSTLKFAKLAKKIVTRPVVNEVSDDGVLAKCLREIESLKQELEKTKKENDEEERSREQKVKLAELMKGILNGRGSIDAAPVLSRKTRRQTWAPGIGLLGLVERRSFSPPCKRERALGLIEENEGQRSNEKLDEMDVEVGEKRLETAAPFVIPAFVPPAQRSVKKCDSEVQTMEPYITDRTDEVLTLKKGNASLLHQLETKKKRVNELETQMEEFTDALESMKDTIKQLQEVASGTQVLEDKLVTVGREVEELTSENLKLKAEVETMKSSANENETNPADRGRLLRRIDELHNELREAKGTVARATDDTNSLKEDKEQLENVIERLREKLSESENAISAQKNEIDGLRNNMNKAKVNWNEEKERLIKEIDDLKVKAHATMGSDTLTESKNQENAELRIALANTETRLAEAIETAKEVRNTVSKEFEQRYSAKIEENEEELQQLRKNNGDLMARIDVLLNERNSPRRGADEELQLLKEEVEELKEVIDRKSKALAVAEKQKEELDFSNKMVERLTREKKDLLARLKAKIDGAEVLSSRVNAMRDEINEKQTQLTQLQHAKKSYDLVKEKLKEENGTLVVGISNLRNEFSEYKADAEARICEKDTRIAHLLEQANSNERRILMLDTDLAIARKDMEMYKNTIASMAKAQDDAQTLASQEGHLRQQLEDALEELSVVKKERQQARDELTSKDKMLKKAMDAVTKLEMTGNISQWEKEKARMSQQVEELQRQLRDANEALEHRKSTSSDSSYREERKRFLEEISTLRQQLVQKAARTTHSSDDGAAEVAKLQQRIQEDEKELNALKEKIRRYRMQKVNGIQYVDELKEKIAKGEKELQDEMKKRATLTEELQRMRQAKAELESLCKENQRVKPGLSGRAEKKSSEERRPLYEEPECKQQ
ncbi:kinesin motor domain protein [Ancylostoma caninum]|uniref:Kinesin motor domain protein n=1 Tax=Ancylostoma caninum TaxID=29170 RepID=A0A368H312_ANCCA|nr:kinesin motor domain protein [Ancylostoma caninum]